MDTMERFRPVVDELVFVATPEPFMAVGYWYEDFEQVEDEEVVQALARAQSWAGVS
jgi:predicted phosphoribosyltransferase